MWYRRITEIEEVDPPPSAARPTPPADNPVLDLAAFTTLPPLSPAGTTLRKRKMSDDVRDMVSHFKRVRLVTKRIRIRSQHDAYHIHVSEKDDMGTREPTDTVALGEFACECAS